MTMGTNYYHVEQEPCRHCGRSVPRRHIGKQSAGWCFGLHVYPDEGIRDLLDWLQRLAVSGYIENEYHDRVTREEMRGFIEDRRQCSEVTHERSWYIENNAEPGPHGLVRHRIDHTCCIGHGDGTWDLIIGDFQ